MNAVNPRSVGHRAAAVSALILFAIFAANIVLFKAGMLFGFSAPRLSAVWEFTFLGLATFFGVAFLIGEETRQLKRGGT